MRYLLTFIFLVGLLYSIPYQEGEYVSEEHQNITQITK